MFKILFILFSVERAQFLIVYISKYIPDYVFEFLMRKTFLNALKQQVLIYLYYNLLRSLTSVPLELPAPGEDVLGSIPAVASRSLLVGSVSV